ncbi:hypothetical protein K0M31_015894 [Melipona bicolor]|uniref:Uncharacterized protein n=1 Tax=Melipona bicolor TaxID=60889 RepID=A0AA40G7A6_9HYME|nr:hypothetical protein K0M31_015894 [Melipona bicolor]
MTRWNIVVRYRGILAQSRKIPDAMGFGSSSLKPRERDAITDIAGNRRQHRPPYLSPQCHGETVATRIITLRACILAKVTSSSASSSS